jgi:hypothetical protein
VLTFEWRCGTRGQQDKKEVESAISEHTGAKHSVWRHEGRCQTEAVPVFGYAVKRLDAGKPMTGKLSYTSVSTGAVKPLTENLSDTLYTFSDCEMLPNPPTLTRCSSYQPQDR